MRPWSLKNTVTVPASLSAQVHNQVHCIIVSYVRSRNIQVLYSDVLISRVILSGGSRGRVRVTPPPPPPLFWVNKEEMTEGKMADRASKSRPGLPLSSRSASATDSHESVTVYDPASLVATCMHSKE